MGEVHRLSLERDDLLQWCTGRHLLRHLDVLHLVRSKSCPLDVMTCYNAVSQENVYVFLSGHSDMAALGTKLF